MKKFYLLMAFVMLCVANASAGIKVLYAQDFESVTSAAEAGWTYGGTSMDIMSDDFGSFLQLNQGATNGRNAQLTWGADIFGENGAVLEDGKYTLTFDFCPKQASNNQYNSGLTVLTNLVPPGNQPFTGRWTYLKDADGNNIEDMSLYQGYLFDLMQVDRTTIDETNSTDQIKWKVNGNADDVILMNADWYTITLNVDVNARTVEYNISDLSGVTLTSGTRTVPATECDGTEISMFATGLWVMVARYQTLFQFDNIKVTCESSADVANDPSVALTGLGYYENEAGEAVIDPTWRQYTITFIEGETLMVKGTDGQTAEISFYDCNGAYKYVTTTSGTLTVWTVCGSAKSNEIVTEVNCEPIAVPAADVNIISVDEGYAKTYKIAVDNSVLPIPQTIFVDYTFAAADGTTTSETNLGNGATFTVEAAGTLTLTSKAMGYVESTVTVVNDKEYGIKKLYDFARLTDEEIAANGFTKDEDLNSASMSGEQNWTARKRLFYYDVNQPVIGEDGAPSVDDNGNPIYAAVYPFGYVADDSECVLHRSIKDADAMAAAGGQVMEGVVAFPGAEEGTFLQAKMLHGVGLIQDATTNNYNAVKFAGLNDNDIIIVNTINGYGSNSIHPVVATEAEFRAQLKGEDVAYVVGSLGTDDLGKKTAGAWKIAAEDGTSTVAFNLYRIDTALVYAKVFADKDPSGINNAVVDFKTNTNAPIYTIGGVRVAKPTVKGLYIQNGKKYIVK